MPSTTLSAVFTAILVLLIAGCDSTNPIERANRLKARTMDTSAVAKEEPTLERLTEETVVAELTAFGKENPETLVSIQTDMGEMKVRLYEQTPLHRANFIRLAKGGFYNQGEFFRVINEFMIQGGDSDTRKMRIGSYEVPMELNPKFFHKKGALAMAKHDWQKGSSSHIFFIVQGTQLTELQLLGLERDRKRKLPAEQREAYLSVGGVPSIDGNYTVFGEVVEGLEVIDKIAAVKTSENDWPASKVRHTIRVLE
jgi:cyclophilin family peptidyl-prolyl cis-trans isomerase